MLFILLLLSTIISAQEYNKIVIDEKSEKLMLIGYTTREAFQDSSFSWWFNSGYDNYSLNKDTLDQLIPEILRYDITIVMGTWCSDSRYEVPKFYKILDSAGYPAKKIKVINVGRGMKDITGEVKNLNIEFVPTFIFSENGMEKGRIVETPKGILEGDIRQIIIKRETVY